MDFSRWSESGSKSRSSSGHSTRQSFTPGYPEGHAIPQFQHPCLSPQCSAFDRTFSGHASLCGSIAVKQPIYTAFDAIPYLPSQVTTPRTLESTLQIPSRLLSRRQPQHQFPGVYTSPTSDISGLVMPLSSVFDSAGFNVSTETPQAGRSVGKVALPSEMPIGSYVHLQTRRAWGVVKITNIPYSITKQEIIQFVGRRSRIISPKCGWPVHIIMERSTAKTMDCYVELDTAAHAAEVVTRINRIYETGRVPRLGNRHVDVEVSSQDALMKDLFPRAKCVSWRDGAPIIVANTDKYSSGFTGFFTSEEIIGAIRHAETPYRSPFCAKCPQRTYESTVSTLEKFPWYATGLYTVGDRNTLFELVNRQVKALVARMKRCSTIGLDRKLLRDLLLAGLKCPAFNERMKYTLCFNSEDKIEIHRLQDIAKWFPFDTLVKLPGFDEQVLLYYVNLISKGSYECCDNGGLLNNFPESNSELSSPYGRIWFEWPPHLAKNKIWEDAVQQEMIILCGLVLSGWIKVDQQHKSQPLEPLCRCFPVASMNESSAASESISPRGVIQSRSEEMGQNEVPQIKHSLAEIYATPSRRVVKSPRRSLVSLYSNPRAIVEENRSPTLPTRLTVRGGRGRSLGHRNTRSSPICPPISRFE